MSTEEVSLESEDDFQMPKMKSCDLCVHKGVCGAYNAIPTIKEKFEQRFQFCEFPAKAISLAVMCKEYKEKEGTEDVKEYECVGCSDKDGL